VKKKRPASNASGSVTEDDTVRDVATDAEAEAEADAGAETDAEPEAEAEAEADTDAEADAGADDSDNDDPDAADPPWERPPARTFSEWWNRAPLARPVHLVLGLIVPAIVLLVNMWRVRAFTIDDAYISFRFARNLARGHGLVYNIGERIEGYTNFLWTVILAVAIKFGLDPEVTAKVLGAASALGGLVMIYTLSDRLRPFAMAPSIATWLASTTIVFTGYAVFGLETSFFVFLLLLGAWLFLREVGLPEGRDPEIEAGGGAGRRKFPWSGLVLGLAGLTRPEAPAFIGLLMISLLLGRDAFGKDQWARRIFTEPRGMFGRENLIRGALFVVPVAAHVAFRRTYYGTFLPNTFSAKTGSLTAQMEWGATYVRDYTNHAGPILYLSLFAVAIGLVWRRRDVLAISAVGAFALGYPVLVGGDWMPLFRFMSPFEPFCFLLVDVSFRAIADRRNRAAMLAIVGFFVIVFAQRRATLVSAQRQIVEKEDRFWKAAAGGTARWLLDNGVPGELAIGDMGYVGYATDYPILDLLGLVDPVISKLEGAYTRKVGPGFTDRLFDKKPMYVLIISGSNDCKHPSVLGSQVIYRDRRFLPMYDVAGKVPLDGGINWCIYRHKEAGVRAP
jgi:arabinofuranosyltransferase